MKNMSRSILPFSAFGSFLRFCLQRLKLTKQSSFALVTTLTRILSLNTLRKWSRFGSPTEIQSSRPFKSGDLKELVPITLARLRPKTGARPRNANAVCLCKTNWQLYGFDTERGLQWWQATVRTHFLHQQEAQQRIVCGR